MQKAAVALQALVVLTFGTSAWGVPLEVSINSASLKDTIVALAIDLVDSSAAPSSLTVSPLGGNAQQTATASLTEGASGSVAAGFTLQDSAFFNEVAIPLRLGDLVSFTTDVALGAPAIGEFPDQLSIFLLTPSLSGSAITTSDPTGSDALLTYNLGADGTPNLTVYAPFVTVAAPPATSVPEPPNGPVLMTAVALLGVLSLCRRKVSR